MSKPYPLHKGDVIGVAAPASPFDKERFYKGIKRLRHLGYKVRFSKAIFSKNGYLAGTDERRAGELNRLFGDSMVKAVFFARGGYGTQRIIPGLDNRVIRKNSKIVMGASDLTALQIYLWEKFHIPSLHGPMVATDLGFGGGLSKATEDFLVGWVGGRGGPRRYKFPRQVKVFKNGRVSGILAGGCLSLIVAGIGTPYELNTRGKILFLEDVGETPYRLDRMLTHLLQAGKFKGVRGVIFCTSFKKGLIAGRLKSFKGPVICGFPMGHHKAARIIPFGLHATLDTYQRRIVFNERFTR